MEERCGSAEFDEIADFGFHLTIAESSGNPLLLGLMNQVSGLLKEMIKETSTRFSAKGYGPAAYYNDHVLIYKAIKEQDEEKARESILLHLENVERILKKLELNSRVECFSLQQPCQLVRMKVKHFRCFF